MMVKRLGRSIARAAVEHDAVRRAVRSLALRGAVPPAVWCRLPAEGIFRVPTSHGDFLYDATPGDGLARSLHWRGIRAYEAETLAVFEHIASRGGTVVDVGANTGAYTLVACAASSEVDVVAFEPVPRLMTRLRRNVELNDWENRCRLLDVALSDSTGTADFVLPTIDVPTSAHLAEAAYRSHEGDVVSVACARLDDVLGDEDIRLVKIDVEGAEDRVLAGMPRLLANPRPEIIVECLPEGPHRAVQRILEEQGYRFLQLRASGPEPVEAIVPDPDRRFRNILCTPR
jgi:FkbM family methyltransferase